MIYVSIKKHQPRLLPVYGIIILHIDWLYITQPVPKSLDNGIRDDDMEPEQATWHTCIKVLSLLTENTVTMLQLVFIKPKKSCLFPLILP